MLYFKGFSWRVFCCYPSTWPTKEREKPMPAVTAWSRSLPNERANLDKLASSDNCYRRNH